MGVHHHVIHYHILSGNKLFWEPLAASQLLCGTWSYSSSAIATAVTLEEASLLQMPTSNLYPFSTIASYVLWALELFLEIAWEAGLGATLGLVPLKHPNPSIRARSTTKSSWQVEKKLLQHCLPTTVSWRRLNGQILLPAQCNGCRNSLEDCLWSRAICNAGQM